MNEVEKLAEIIRKHETDNCRSPHCLSTEKDCDECQAEYILKTGYHLVEPVQTEELEGALEFAGRVARVMDELKSSHVFFILQEAYDDRELEWEEAQKILTKATINESKGQLYRLKGE